MIYLRKILARLGLEPSCSPESNLERFAGLTS